MTLTSLFDEAVERKASDIHLSTGEIPSLRIAGQLVRIESEPIDAGTMNAWLDEFLSPDARARLDIGQPAERSVVRGDLSFSGIVFRYDSDGTAATFRILAKGVPDLEKIGEGAMSFFEQLSGARRGLVLITGPVGSGKTTTASSLVDRINANRPDRIFVVSQHPNYRFESKRGMVTQMHVGQAIDGYVTAMNVAHQADLDVILLDDLPTTEELRNAILLADTGHLVIANLHSEGAADALQRLFDTAGPNLEALRRALSQTLLAVTGQRLFPRLNGSGRVPAYEWIGMSPAMRQAIAEGDLSRVRELQEVETESRSFQAAIDALVTDEKVSPEADAVYR